MAIAIDRDIRIPKGSTATVISPDIISPKAILLEFTTATAYYVDHDTLVAKISRKGLEEVQTKAEALIVSLDSAINSISSIFQRNEIESSKEHKKHTDHFNYTGQGNL